MATEQVPQSAASRLAREYLTGSLASSLTYLMFSPLEVVKTRLQIQDGAGWTRVYHSGFVRTTLDLLRSDGPLMLWSHGLVAGVARDFTYSGIRTGMYPTVRDAISAACGSAEAGPSFHEKVAAGATTGSAGAGLANAIDVVRVRMLADSGRVDSATGKYTSGLREGHAPRWTSSLHCLRDTARTEGVVQGLLLRGVSVSMARAGLLTAAQMSTYDHAKTVARRNGIPESTALHVAAALISGLAATAACNPADVLKSRVMSSGGGAGGSGSSVLGMVWRIVTHEGPLGFYRGFLPAYARIGPTILIQLPVAEALRRAFGVRSL